MGGINLRTCSHMEPTQISKILRPSVVLSLLVSLFLCATIGLGATVAIFAVIPTAPIVPVMGASQALMIVTSGISFLYITLHIVAASYNKPSHSARNRLHATCFTVAWLGFLSWTATLVTCILVLAGPGKCSGSPGTCRYQILNIVIASVSFLVMGVLLISLKTRRYPFAVPTTPLYVAPVSRFSISRDDMTNRSVSVASSRGTEVAAEFQTESPKRSFESTTSSQYTYVSMEIPRQTYPSPVLPMIPISKECAWSEEVNHLVREDSLGRKSYSRADSAISIDSDTCSDTCSDAASSTFSRHSRQSSLYSRRSSAWSRKYSLSTKELPACPRAVTPTSSISDEALRSPLSRVRSAESPDIVYQPQMIILRARSTKTSKAPRPMSVVNLHKPRDSLALTGDIATQITLVRRLGPPSYEIPKSPLSLKHVRRSSSVYVDDWQNFDEFKQLEENTRKIMTNETRNQQSSKSRLSTGYNPLRSHPSCRVQPLVLSKSDSIDENCPSRFSIDSRSSGSESEAEDDDLSLLKRLTLEDISAEFEDIFSSFSNQV